jgi:hypothetical protein
MARKLSNIAYWITFFLIAGSIFLAESTSSAQTEPPSADSPKVVDNPFISAQPQPQTFSEPQQKSHRPPIAYQNPFTAASKSPPVDTSLRPGPLSRWRHPAIPGDDSSAIKSAVLFTPAAKPAHPMWDQLPPAEDLRNRTLARGQETDPTFFARLTTTPNAIQFMPKPLTQPNWLTESDEIVSRESRPIEVSQAVFDSPLKTASFANQTSSQTSGSQTERAQQVNRASTQSMRRPPKTIFHRRSFPIASKRPLVGWSKPSMPPRLPIRLRNCHRSSNFVIVVCEAAPTRSSPTHCGG